MPNQYNSFNLASPELVSAELVPSASQADAQQQLLHNRAVAMVDSAKRGELELDSVLGLDLPPTSSEDALAFRRRTVIAAAGMIVTDAYQRGYTALQSHAGRGAPPSQLQIGRSELFRKKLLRDGERQVPVAVDTAVAIVGLAATLGDMRFPVRSNRIARTIAGPRVHKEQPINYPIVLKRLNSRIQLADVHRPAPIDTATRIRNAAIEAQIAILPQVVPAGKHGQTILF